MAIQKTEAFVLRTHPFRTSSLIVTTFSRSFGKVRGVAKGVRREGLLWSSAYEPFTLLEMVFYEKLRSELHLISEVSLLESFEGLRSNLELLATAYYLAELVDQLTEPHDPHPLIFELLHFTFQGLPSFPPSFLARFFEIRLLSEVGLLPHLESCLGCGEKNPKEVYFSARQGALFCSPCRRKAPEARRLSLETLEVMRRLTELKGQESSLTPPNEMAWTPSLEKEMEEVTERFLTERLGRRLPTRSFLRQVRSLTVRATLKPTDA